MLRDVPGCSGMFHVPSFIDGLFGYQGSQILTGFLEIDFQTVIFVLLDFFNSVVRLVFHSKEMQNSRQ